MFGLEQVMALLKGANNPASMLGTLAGMDPRIQQIQQIINQNGGDAKAAFYSLAKQKGVDPEAILQQVRNMGGGL